MSKKTRAKIVKPAKPVAHVDLSDVRTVGQRLDHVVQSLHLLQAAAVGVVHGDNHNCELQAHAGYFEQVAGRVLAEASADLHWIDLALERASALTALAPTDDQQDALECAR